MVFFNDEALRAKLREVRVEARMKRRQPAGTGRGMRDA